MKIALIGPVHPYRGGIAHYTTMLYRALQEAGHETLLVSYRRMYPKFLFPGQSDRDPSQSALEAPGAQYWIDSLNPFTWLIALWRIRKSGPGRVVLQWWTPFWAPFMLTAGLFTRLFRMPALVICHNVIPHDSKPRDKLLVRLALGLYKTFIVQSEAEKQNLLSLMPAVSAVVVPHPVYDMFTGDRPSREEARKTLSLPSDAPVILFFGIVRPYKGLRDLVQAFPTVLQSHPQAILLVAGEFWEPRQEYEDLIASLGITESIHIHDRYIPNEEVPVFFTAADLLVAPYKRTSGSGVVQMARGFGLPVITTHEGHGKEDPYLIIIPSNDPAAIGKNIIIILQTSFAHMPLPSRVESVADWHTLADVISHFNGYF